MTTKKELLERLKSPNGRAPTKGQILKALVAIGKEKRMLIKELLRSKACLSSHNQAIMAFHQELWPSPD